MNTDEQDLASARAAWSARKTESSLVAWTLSPEWTAPTWAKSTERRQAELALLRGSRKLASSIEVCSGDAWRSVRNGETVSGEITAATCACHRPDGRPW